MTEELTQEEIDDIFWRSFREHESYWAWKLIHGPIIWEDE